ncbi:MAG TPA: SDR family oxidoreductase [Roseiflexaceae bacterium]|nr:SDR family oxidoreductase [Roseiflexaceae bacterium]
MQPLKGKVAVVAGATRGAGRGIARMLGEAGATVYCTGRSSRSAPAERPTGVSPFDLRGRPETIEETAELVAAHGGEGIPVRVDHTDERQVAGLFERVHAEQGRLDLLVNDVWGGDDLVEWGTPFWELSVEKGLLMQQRAVHTHIITSRHGAPLLVERGAGLIIEITDGDTPGYRGNLFYDLAKSSVIRLAYAMAEELRPHGVAALALTPGFLRSEAMLEHFGVSEANWRDGAQKDPHFIASETPFFVGRAVAALAADPEIMRKSGGAFSSWGLADEYGFTDQDGSRPHWGRYFAEHLAGQEA